MLVSTLTGFAYLSQTFRVRGLLAALAFFICFTAALQVAAQSSLDGFDPNANARLRTVIVQPDGKILIGGDFTTLAPNGGAAVTRNRVARLNPDGTLDTLFNPDVNDEILSMALQADGKVLIGGDFTSVGGQTRNHLARLDAVTGAPDSFNPNPNDAVFTIVVQPDTKILVGGRFSGTSIGGQVRNRIARLDATGLADSFNPSASAEVFSIMLQDGKILVGGFFTSIGGQTRNRIARVDAMTGAADSFNPNANSIVYSMTLEADGKILAGGSFTNIGGLARNGMVRLDPTTGAADPLFNPNANNNVYWIVLQADGKILIGGVFSSIGGQTRNRIARINPTTGVADSFDPNVPGGISAIYGDGIAVQANGKILVVGAFSTLAPNGGAAVTRNNIARLNPDGTLDQTLDANIIFASDREVVAIAVQPDGKILIGGIFTSVLGVTRNNIARLNANGTLDMAFDPNANGDVIAIAVQADGNILASGRFTNIGSAARNRIARLDATTGTADLLFNPDANELVFSIVPLADGKILVGGRFSGVNSIGGATRNRIARLNSNGTADSFNPDANNDVFVISVQADGMILAGGRFTTIGGVMRNRVARLDSGGVLDSFNPDANNTVNAIAVQPDGKILAGGSFTSIGAATRNRIARLDSGGAADAFNPDASAGVNAIAVQTDGKILVSGDFTIINTLSRIRIARLDPGGTVDSFNPNPNNNNVFAIALQTDGKVLVGGRFTTIGGQARSLFARLTNDTAALQNLAVTQTTVTWTRDGASPNLWRVVFEQSTDGGANYTFLGDGTRSFAPLAGGKGESQFVPTASNWTLTGLTLTTGQNIHIRARGFYRTGHENASDSITETVKNVFLLPSTAASVSISGRVLRGKGYSVGNAVVSLTGSSGSPRQARTGSFGYYRFDNVDVGQTYIISVSSKRYQFEPQVVFLLDDIGDLDFIALP